ncbi:MAG: hypothetical protein EP344_09250 [Bacteroidetes bacterium]|nr:MAG: hypothetical protein EP344_09250 [Bacteroidota bacterium]
MLQQKVLLLVGVLALLTSCNNNPATTETVQATTHTTMEQKEKSATGAIMLIVRIKTNLSKEELLKRAHEREPQFAALPGLLQKYYIELGPQEYGGVYIWDSMESLAEYRASELAATIPKAYEATAPPSVELVNILFSLRD